MSKANTTTAFKGIVGSMESYTPLIVLFIAAVLLLAWHRLGVQMDPLEPPQLKPRIPLVGHLIGMIRYQSVYFEMLK